MGTGKSKTFIDFCNGVNARRILILCPSKVVPVWPFQFKTHSHTKYLVIAESGPIKKRALKIEETLKANLNIPIVVVLNFEAFWREPLGPSVNAKNRIIKNGILKDQKWDVIALDEAHRIKSPNGKASWGAARIRKSTKYRRCLSGTPMPSSPLDIYAQFRFLDPTVFGTSFARCRTQYAEMGGFENKQVLRFINISDLNQKFYAKAHRIEKRDVLDLPPVMHETLNCKLSPSAMKIYKQLDEEFVADVGSGEVTASNALVKMLRLAQFSGGCAMLDDKSESIIDKSKIDTVLDKLEDLPPKEPIVIVCKFVNEIRRIKAAIESQKINGKQIRTVAELSGNCNQLLEWQQGKFDVIVMQIGTGAEGIDLTRSCYSFLMSVGCSLGQYEQFLARQDRYGQLRSVTYLHICAIGTIDVKINKALRDRKNVIESVLDQTLTPFGLAI